jgi:hypothetical protein
VFLSVETARGAPEVVEAASIMPELSDGMAAFIIAPNPEVAGCDVAKDAGADGSR